MDYYLPKIFNFVYDEYLNAGVDVKEVFEMEIRYLNILEHPRIINDELAKSPELFVHFIEKSYLSRSESGKKEKRE